MDQRNSEQDSIRKAKMLATEASEAARALGRAQQVVSTSSPRED